MPQMNTPDIYTKYSLSRIHADWACLIGQEYRLKDLQFREEAMVFARQIMRKARIHILEIIRQLQQENYIFLDVQKAHLEPEPDMPDWIRSLEQRGIYIPLSLAAWLCEVGAVNLIGTHPEWPKPGYIFGTEPKKFEPTLADPLVVELPQEYAEYLYSEWKCSEDSGVVPFRVEVAPDHLHKANLSGGLPYQLLASRPCVDGILLNERHSTSFVHYLRIALLWGGFPGLEYIQEIPSPSRGKVAI
jgi:hypothetical protein